MDQTVKLLLTRTGKDLTLVSRTLGSYDVTTGAPSSTSESTETVKGHIIDYSDELKAKSIVVANSRKAVIAAKGVSNIPKVEDRIRDGSTDWIVKDVKKIVKNSTTLAYICRVEL